MKLYHYSSSEFETLKTLEKQGLVTQRDREKSLISRKQFKESFKTVRPGDYFQHISFFFERIPLDISKYFPKDHSVWKRNNTLYEYEVESGDLSPFGYEIVEFPEKRTLYLDDSISTEEYHKGMREFYSETRYIGFGDSEMKHVCQVKNLTNVLQDSFKQLNELPWFHESDIRYKYAPLVTHVMIYPDGGEIKPSSVKKIRLT